MFHLLYLFMFVHVCLCFFACGCRFSKIEKERGFSMFELVCIDCKQYLVSTLDSD